jgi:Cu/Ag efflux pump CusA
VQEAFNYVSTMGGSLKDATYILLGEDNTQLQDYSEKAQQIMQNIPGAVDKKSTYKPGKPEVQLQIKPGGGGRFRGSPAAPGPP